jgi:hypothetical protein
MRYFELFEDVEPGLNGTSHKNDLNKLKNEVTYISQLLDKHQLDSHKMLELGRHVLNLVTKIKKLDRNTRFTKDVDITASSLENFVQQAEHRLNKGGNLPDGDLVTFKSSVKKVVKELISSISEMLTGFDAAPANNHEAASQIQNLALATIKRTDDKTVQSTQVKIAKTASTITEKNYEPKR